MSLLNTKTGFTTPWHCCVALTATGEWTSAPKGEYLKDPNMKIIHENGRPSYFQEVVARGESDQKAETETGEVNISESLSNPQHSELQEPANSSLTEAERERVTALARFVMSADFKHNGEIVKSGYTSTDRVLDCNSNELNTVAWLKELIYAAAKDTGGYNKKVPGVTYQDIPANGAQQLSNT
jgi:ATP-binding cassette, subfamily G (WHITE), member 2, PDR